MGPTIEHSAAAPQPAKRYYFEDVHIELAEQLREILSLFPSDPVRHRRALMAILGQETELVFPAVMELWRADREMDGLDVVVTIMTANGRLTAGLSIPFFSPLEEAIDFCRDIFCFDNGFDVRLMQELSLHDVNSSEGRRRIRRLLDLLAALPGKRRIMPVLLRLLRNSDRAIRAKIVPIICRANPDLRALHSFTRDPDARVRANAIEALWGVDDPDIIAFFRYAVFDRNRRVVANALVGLHMGRGGDAIVAFRQILQRSDNSFKLAAARAMGISGYRPFEFLLGELVSSQQKWVRRCAEVSLEHLKRRRETPIV